MTIRARAINRGRATPGLWSVLGKVLMYLVLIGGGHLLTFPLLLDDILLLQDYQ